MVVKMMKWSPWPPSSSKKHEVEAILSIKSIEGLNLGTFRESENRAFFVEVQWKGQQKGMALGSLRRSTKRNLTGECFVSENGVVRFDDEEFRNVCGFAGPKDGLFYPWEIVFTVFNVLNLSQGLKSKTTVLGTLSLNLAEYASATEGKDFSLKIPLILPGCSLESCPFLNISLTVSDVTTAQELSGTAQRSRTPSPVSPLSFGLSPPAKDERSALKASLRKVKTFTDFVSSRKAKKTLREEDGSDCRSSVRSNDAPSSDPFDIDSLDDDMAGVESEETKDDLGVKHSVSYESLASANCAQWLFYASAYGNGEDECLVYYSNRHRYDECCSQSENSSTIMSEEIEQPRSKRGFLSWKKRKLNFIKALKAKDEPLLKKHCEEEGGDDIDYDRRQLSSSVESSFLPWQYSSTPNRPSISEFGDDNFAVGSWESKEVTSRDGLMKLQTRVFFASIDQRSERAAGESACTALVAVVADWLRSNRGVMPVKSEFDRLIRDGSSEWRNLCENEDYLDRFPDKHFDLETVLEAKIRPLAVAPEKSFIGFFHPEGLQDGELDLLHGAMSFDSIWDEISSSVSDLPCDTDSSAIYIVSWNDHFFVLKADRDAYYLIDTLGERLFERCNQAYVLKFDKDTAIQRVPKEEAKQPSDDKSANQPEDSGDTKGGTIAETDEKEEEVLFRGKESCKEYIKSFLAAIPIRELQADLKKGLTAMTLVHHRLQIEFHFTKPLQLAAEYPAKEIVSGTV